MLSPITTLVHYLKRVSRSYSRRGNPDRVWKIPWRKLGWESGRTRWLEFMGLSTEEKKADRERIPDILRRSCSSIQLNTNQHMHMWKLLPRAVARTIWKYENSAQCSHRDWNNVCSQQPGWKTSWIMSYRTKQRSAIFFCKGPDSIYLMFF